MQDKVNSANPVPKIKPHTAHVFAGRDIQLVDFCTLKTITMKKSILFIAVALVAAIGVRAQGGGGQQRTPEERAKQTMERLADLKLDKDQTDKTSTVFKEYYEARQKMMQEMRAGGGQPDRDQMREKGQKLSAERDDKLKKIFTEDQFKKWKDEIEPSMRPNRGGGGGNGN